MRYIRALLVRQPALATSARIGPYGRIGVWALQSRLSSSSATPDEARRTDPLSVLLEAYHDSRSNSFVATSSSSSESGSPPSSYPGPELGTTAKPRLNLYRALTRSELSALWTGLSSSSTSSNDTDTGTRWWEIDLHPEPPQDPEPDGEATGTEASASELAGEERSPGDGKALQTVYGFETWGKAMEFFRKAEEIIGTHDHHPTITIHPNPHLQITQISITTHTHTPRPRPLPATPQPSPTMSVDADSSAKSVRDEVKRSNSAATGGSRASRGKPPPGLTRKDFLLAKELDGVYDGMYAEA